MVNDTFVIETRLLRTDETLSFIKVTFLVHHLLNEVLTSPQTFIPHVTMFHFLRRS